MRLAAVGGVDGDVVLRHADEGQFDGPVVGQVDDAPGAVVEAVLEGAILGVVDPVLAGLGEGALADRRAPAEVFHRIVRVAKVEAPAEVEQHLFPWGGLCSKIRSGFVAVRRALGLPALRPPA